MKFLKQLWQDEDGGTNSAELILLGTILVIGIVPGVATLRDAILTELADVAAAIDSFYDPPHHHHSMHHSHHGFSIRVASDMFN